MFAKRAHRDDGFTLIELLVTIAVISLLIGIMLPALGKARVASKRTLALSNARSTAMSFENYLGDNKDTYPFIAPREDPMMPGGGMIFFKWYPEGVMIGSSDLFTLDWAWPAAVSSVAPWAEHYETWVSPGMDTALPASPDDPIGGDHEPSEAISWRLSSAFLGDPAIWNAERAASADAALVRAVRGHEVARPAGKVLLWDTHVAYLPREPELRDGHWDAPTPMAFADGHAEMKNPLEAREGVANPLRGGANRRLENTADGVRGVDY